MAFSQPSMEMYHQAKWDEALTEFSHQLAPPLQTLKEAEKIVNQLFVLLKNNSKYSIDRQMIFGSIAKKTALKSQHDFDCVFFINEKYNEELPFADVLSEFEDIINKHNWRANIEESTDPTRHVLTFHVDGMKFDLVPAVNFRVSNRSREEQLQGTLKRIRNHDGKKQHKAALKYNSSLAEYQVNFIESQTEFARDVIRLAKYWNKTVFLSEYISGRSTLIEYLATRAANSEESESGSRKSIWKAFNKFLMLIVGFSQLNVVFNKFYQQNEIDYQILTERPLILDPVNPFMNMANALSKSPEVLSKLQNFAKETIARLKSKPSGLPNLTVVFKMQPEVMPPDFLSKFGPKNGSVVTQIEDLSLQASINPKMIVRNEKKYNKLGVRLIQSYLSNNVEIIKGTQLSKTKLQDKVTEIIDKQVYGLSYRQQWSSGYDNHEDHDISFEVPCGDKLIKLSFNWQ